MTPKSQIYVIIIIFLVITALAITGMFYFLINNIRENYSTLISQKKELLLLKLQAENLLKFQQHYLVFREKLDKVNEVFLDPETPFDFLNFLEEVAKKNQLPIEVSINPAKETKGDIWPSLSFKVFLNGSFPKVLKFLEKIENGLYLTELESLKTTRVAEEEIRKEEAGVLATGDVRANLVVKVYTK